MFRTGQTDTLCSERTSHLRVVRCIGIRPYLKLRIFVTQIHQRLEVTGEFSRFRRYFSGINLSRRTVQGDVIAFFIYNAFDLHCLVLVVHIDGTGTGHTTFTHTTSHYGRMGSHTSTSGKDTFGCRHTGQIFGRGLDTYHNHPMAVLTPFLGIICVEHDLSASRPRRRRQPLCNHLGFFQRIFVKHGVEKLVQFLRLATFQCRFLVYQSFTHQVHGDFHHSCTGTFTVARLQKPKFTILNCKLHILHIAIVVFQFSLNGIELFINLRHSLFHRRIFGGTFFLRDTLQGSPTA